MYIVQGQEKLSKFLRWAVSTAVQSKSEESLHPDDSNVHSTEESVKKPSKESLVSKLLRWLTASVILGKISRKSSKLNNGSFSEIPTIDSLQSWLRCPEKESGENAGYGCEDILAASIFYLIQLLDFGDRLLPSAVSAICLLLLSGSSGLFLHLSTSFYLYKKLL